ncbi:MAG: HD domain-containing phosphohydrolase [Pseudomonadota bacterium]
MPTIAIISENLTALVPAAKKLQAKWRTELFSWDGFNGNLDLQDTVIIFDVNLHVRKNVEKLRAILSRKKKNVFTIFYVSDPHNRSEVIHANSLGAMVILERPVRADVLIKKVYLFDLIKSSGPALLQSKSADAFNSMSDLMETMKTQIKENQPIDAKPVYRCGEKVIDSVKSDEIDALLAAVRTHHSNTYRHSMTVTVLATSFAALYKMNAEDSMRLTVGGLLHDIGKSMISPTILNKTTKLNEIETIIMRQHTVNGSNVLDTSRNFDREIVNIARHHHEFLDGTGYPDGLKGSEISDIIRIMTICDLFAAMTEPKGQKGTVKPKKAYQSLLDMRGKLDMDLVAAFRPIALAKEDDPLSRKLRSIAAA